MQDQLLSRHLELEHQLHHLVSGLDYRSCTGAAVMVVSGGSASPSGFCFPMKSHPRSPTFMHEMVVLTEAI